MLPNKTFQNNLTHKHKYNFQFQNINEEVIINIIDKLALKTSCGFDGISSKLLKTIKMTLINPNTLIINQMLNSEIVPDKLNIAKIILIHKKMMKICSQIINQFHFYLQFLKYLKGNF